MTGKQKREACRVLIMGFILIWEVVTKGYTFVKIHWAVYLRFVCFTVCILYFSKKIKEKGVVRKEAEGRIRSNIWVEIPRSPKLMRKEVSAYSQFTDKA